MWVNVVTLILVLAIVFLESKRGFGRAMFDALGAILSLRFAFLLAPGAAERMHLVDAARANEALWLGVLFVMFGALALLGSKVLYDYTLLSLDVFDPLLGAIFGAVSAGCAAHVLLRALIIAYVDTPTAELVTTSFAYQELVRFRSYNDVLNALHNLGKW